MKKYCCVPSMTLKYSTSKEYFLRIMGTLWDKEHRKTIIKRSKVCQKTAVKDI